MVCYCGRTPPQDAAKTAPALRALIFGVARKLPEADRVEECLKWGQPAYLTAETGAGSTLRLERDEIRLKRILH